MKAIRSLLETRDEERCPKRSEVDSSKKQEILKILEELKRSYSSLAESHDQLRSNTKSIITSGICDDPRVMDSSDPESMVEDPENSDCDLEKKSSYNNLTEPTDKVWEEIDSPLQEFRISGYSEWEKSEAQCKFEVIRLIEENLQEQAELVRRNEQKRGIIQGLRSEMEGLKAEIRTLQECLLCRKIDLKRVSNNSSNNSLFKMSSFGGLIMGKFFRRSFS